MARDLLPSISRTWGGKTMQTQEWSNYETWAVAQWLRVDDWTAEEVRSVVAALEAGAAVSHLRVSWQLAEWFRERLEAGFPHLESGIYERLLQGAIEHVDWDALAEHVVAKYGLRERTHTERAA
jgi:hypothetical protein